MDQQQASSYTDTQLPGNSLFEKVQNFFTDMSTKKKLFVFGGSFLVILIVALVGGILAASDTGPQQTAVTNQKPTGAPSRNTLTTPSNTISSNYPTPLAKATADQTVPENSNTEPTMTPIKPLPNIPTFSLGIQNPPKAGQTNPYKYQIWQENDDDTIDTVRLVSSDGSFKAIGETTHSAPGDSAFFTNDFSTFIFVGSSVGDIQLQKISFYSISQGKIIYQISIEDMRNALPRFAAETTSFGTLSRMVPSPDGKKLAFSYGVTQHVSQIDPNTAMLVLDLQTSKLDLINAKGLVRSWKDNKTLVYELNTPVPTLKEYPGYQYHPYEDNPNNITKEISITKIVPVR